MASYKVVWVPLDNIFQRLELSAPGVAVPDIGIQVLPAGAAGNVFLRIGAGGDPIPLGLMGQAFHTVPAENDGIYLDNAVVQPGVQMCVLLGFAVGVSSPGR